MSARRLERRLSRARVERVLTRHALVAGPRDAEAGLDPFPRRLAAALGELGPLFAAFARYLADRADVLPMDVCMALSGVPEVGPELAPADVDELLAAELGRPRAEVFPAFDRRPFAVGPLHQKHRGLLADGQPVVVWLRLPWTDGVADELEALAGLAAVFGARGAGAFLSGGDDVFTELVSDFRRLDLEQWLDLRRQAASLDGLRADVENLDGVRVPRVFRTLSSPRVLVVETFQGLSLDEVAAASLRPAEGFDLARRLALAWLQLAVSSRSLPVRLEVEVSRDHRLTITGGVFSGLPASSRPRLWDYLRATAGHYPDRACSYLRAELAAGPGADDIELRTRLRQVVPFRDGGWTRSGESVAEYALQHWRWSRASGFRVPGHLGAFYRGLFWVARCGQQLAPDADPVAAGLDGLQWLASFNQWRQLAVPRQAAAAAETYWSGLSTLPQKLDRALSGLERGDTVLRLRADERRRGTASATAGGHSAALALALGLVAVSLLARAVADALPTAAWIEGVAAVLFVGLGALLLVAALKPGRRR